MHLCFQACRYGHVQHLEHLLFYGADMSSQNASGNTALHVCALYNQVTSWFFLIACVLREWGFLQERHAYWTVVRYMIYIQYSGAKGRIFTELCKVAV